MTFWQATLDTRNFSFEAFGETKDDAQRALVSGLREHGFRYDINADWWRALVECFAFRELTMGAAYRDREALQITPGGMHLSDPDSPKGAKR